jgi:hypothetical protein
MCKEESASQVLAVVSCALAAFFLILVAPVMLLLFINGRTPGDDLWYWSKVTLGGAAALASLSFIIDRR